MPHLSDVREEKTPFQLATVLLYVKQTAETTVAKDLKPGMSPWDAVGQSILELVQEGSNLLPLALETESVTKRKICQFFAHFIN
jgi:dynactin 1